MREQQVLSLRIVAVTGMRQASSKYKQVLWFSYKGLTA